MTKLSAQDLDLIFREARSYRYWVTEEGEDEVDVKVEVEKIKEIYNLLKMGPTANNIQPARFVWVTTAQARTRLADCVFSGNVNKIQTAAMTVIIATDSQFYDELPRLTYNGEEVKEELKQDPQTTTIALRNSSLQGAYLMMAARALGWDCGPMSGFDDEKINQEFFPDGRYKVNFLCALGKGDKSRLRPREYRYEFEEINEVI